MRTFLNISIFSWRGLLRNCAEHHQMSRLVVIPHAHETHSYKRIYMDTNCVISAIRNITDLYWIRSPVY